MISLATEKSARDEVNVTEFANAQDDPYDVKKCAKWIQTNALKQVKRAHLEKNISHALTKRII